MTRPTPPAEPDCIGPIAISRDLARELTGLATAAAADDLTPFWVCATELVHRWSRNRAPVCARVIRERSVAVATPNDAASADPATGAADAAHPADSAGSVRGPVSARAEHRVSFRTALRHAATRPVPAPGPPLLTDVAIVISADGERMYLERMSVSEDGPSLALWAESFLQLLSSLAGRPDAPAITRHDREREPSPPAPVLAAS